MDLQSAEIYSNTAQLGAGIFMCTYGGRAANYDGQGFNLTVKDGVIIRNNTATSYGGGVYMSINYSNDVGFNQSGTAISPEFKLDVVGGEIRNNIAPKGAGIAIMDCAPKRHKNTETNVWSLEYKRNVYIRGGKIYNNVCTTTSSGTQGAGIFINKFAASNIGTGTDQSGYTYEQAGGAGTMTVNATGGLIYGNASRNKQKWHWGWFVHQQFNSSGTIQ